MKGLSAKNISPSLLSVGQTVSRIVQDYYPSFAKRIIILRAPMIFQIAYNALKPFIDASMREKLIITTEKNYKQVLEQYVDPNVLPSEIYPGGTAVAVDEFDTVWKGGKIPDHEEAPLTEDREVLTLHEAGDSRADSQSTTIIPQWTSSPRHRAGRIRSWLNRRLQNAFACESGYFGHPLYTL